jgi:tetratricopeptide (TPR) repeat protein
VILLGNMYKEANISKPPRGISLAYKDLALRLSSEGKHHFVATAIDDGRGVTSNSFELRFDELKIIEHLLELEKKAVEPYSKTEYHKEFGQLLYNKVLARELGSYFRECLEASGDGLRVSLQFDDNAQELANLPWEFLYDGEDFLVARRNVLISRMPSVLKKVDSMPLESSLKMLVVISAPYDHGYALLDTKKERDRILQAVDGLYVQRKIEVDFTDDSTFETIQSYLNEKDYHIVHFIGHGTKIDGQSFLFLENEDLTADKVDDQVIADLFAGRGIRLMVLSACHSASLADRLVRRGVPAVVAMQYSILDPSAIEFAFTFYKALASDKAIDLSLTEARLAMRNVKGGNKIDFATPVLYMLDPDCLHVERIKPAPSEFILKPIMLTGLEVMKDDFVGRRRELRILQKAFIYGAKRAEIVHGWGGIGKTVLATRLAMNMSRHFEGVYGHKCNPQTRPEDILNGLCAFLNLAGISALNQVLYSRAPLQVKTAVLVSILNQKRFLILLDNFESCLDESYTRIADPELRQFVEHLLDAATSNTKYIITTRHDFDPLEGRLLGAIEHLSVPEMPLYEAVWLMNNHDHLASLDFEKKKEIYKNIGGHPWTIGMFAKHARSATVGCLLLELEPLEQKLKEFTLFNKSYSKLDDVSRNLLIRTSVFEETVPVEALRWIVGDEKNPSPSVDEPLDMLVSWGLLIQQVKAGETLYSVHTLVRQFVGQEAERVGIDRQSMLVRAAQYYELRFKESESILDHLRARDYYYRAEEWDQAAKIAIIAQHYLDRWGFIGLAIKILNQSAETTSGTMKAVVTGELGTIYQNLGDWKTALKLHSKVKKFFEREGDRANVAKALHQMGVTYSMQGNFAKGFKLLQNSLDIFNKLEDKQNIAICLHDLGNINYLRGNYGEATKLYQNSLDISKELGDKRGIAKSLSQLGIIHDIQGNSSEAFRLLRQSLDVDKELGNERGIAQSLHGLAIIYHEHGNYSEAIKLYQQSLDIRMKLGDKQGIAQSLHQLGNIHYHQGNYPEATKRWQQSLDIRMKLGDKQGIAQSLYQLGNIYYHQGNYPEATKRS